MSNGQRDAQSGVSYSDVANIAQSVGREYGGRVHFELHLPVRTGHGVVLEVRCCIKRPTGKLGEWLDSGGVGGRWPSGASATFAGLLFRLAYELGAKLDDEKTVAELAARAQKRLL